MRNILEISLEVCDGFTQAFESSPVHCP